MSDAKHEQRKFGVRHERLSGVPSRERQLVAMAQGDPGLPGGHRPEDVGRVWLKKPGKWQGNQHGPDRPRRSPEQNKEIELTVSECLGSIMAGTFSWLLARAGSAMISPSLVSFFTGVAIGRGFRAGFVSGGALGIACRIVLGLLAPLFLAWFMYPPIGLSLATLWFLGLTVAGGLVGYYDSSFMGLRKFYPKSWL